MAKRNIFGLIYDDRSGKVCFDDDEVPPVGGDFTFECPKDFSGQDVNPLQYATDKTGAAIVDMVKEFLPKGTNFRLYRAGDPPALQLEIERAGIKESFNVGLIANSIIRSGSISHFKFDLKLAGILF